MYQPILALIAVALTIVPLEQSFAAGGGEAGDLEHARMNALAGGPISERDAELLQRWGCLSGTRSAFCEQLNHGGVPSRPERRYHKKGNYRPQ